jgi:hypothetical protein
MTTSAAELSTGGVVAAEVAVRVGTVGVEAIVHAHSQAPQKQSKNREERIFFMVFPLHYIRSWAFTVVFDLNGGLGVQSRENY